MKKLFVSRIRDLMFSFNNGIVSDHGPARLVDPYGRDRYLYPDVEIHYTIYGKPSMNYQPQSFPPVIGSKGKIFSFTEREIKELFISIGVLTIAFSMLLGRFDEFINYLPAAFIAVFTGFFLHEMGHKFVAQSYGLFSEFRMNGQGLMLALVTSFMGFLIAAPGAVTIMGYSTKEQTGKTSFAGPSVNVAIALIAFPFLFVDMDTIVFTATLVVFINAFLALFNLIPVHPLDGEKILNWSPGHYFGLVLIALILFFSGLTV